MEAADRNTRSLKGTDPVIHQLTSRTGGRNQPCSRCGKTTHSPPDCKMPNAMIVARRDTSLPSAGRSRTKTRGTPRRSQEHMVRIWCKKAKGNILIQKNSTYTISRKHAQALSIYLFRRAKPLTMELDTGAVSIISRKSMFPQLKLGHCAKNVYECRLLDNSMFMSNTEARRSRYSPGI